MNYETYVGLVLNRHRVRKQRAAAVLDGVSACSNDPLDERWADAVADSPEEAAEIHYETNRERARSRSREKG